jgi:hypothetical protein
VYRNKGIYYLRKKDKPNATRLFEQAKKLDDFVEGLDSLLAVAKQ